MSCIGAQTHYSCLIRAWQWEGPLHVLWVMRSLHSHTHTPVMLTSSALLPASWSWCCCNGASRLCQCLRQAAVQCTRASRLCQRLRQAAVQCTPAGTVRQRGPSGQPVRSGARLEEQDAERGGAEPRAQLVALGHELQHKRGRRQRQRRADHDSLVDAVHGRQLGRLRARAARCCKSKLVLCTAFRVASPVLPASARCAGSCRRSAASCRVSRAQGLSRPHPRRFPPPPARPPRAQHNQRARGAHSVERVHKHAMTALAPGDVLPHTRACGRPG